MSLCRTISCVKSQVSKWQLTVWKRFIVPIADVFKVDCEYCWFWRGVLIGSIITSTIFSIVIGVA